MRTRLTLFLTLLLLVGSRRLHANDSASLAHSLAQEGRYRLAALEYRRLALSSSNTTTTANCYWLASHAYAAAGDSPLAEKMLLLAEESDPLALEREITWQRAELAVAQRDWHAADFYFKSLLLAGDAPEWHDYATRNAAAVALHQGNSSQATALAPPEVRPAIAAYTARRDKSPRLGGLLGILPGLGYLYSGEYGNATRSLLLNSIFIWGMYTTAEDDKWGLFAVITFAELTWYSGSIYGGIDAAHRYNTRRLDTTIEAVRGPQPRLNREKLPLITVQFGF